MDNASVASTGMVPIIKEEVSTGVCAPLKPFYYKLERYQLFDITEHYAELLCTDKSHEFLRSSGASR